MGFEQIGNLSPEEVPATPRGLVQHRLIGLVAIDHQVVPGKTGENYRHIAKSQTTGFRDIGSYKVSYKCVNAFFIGKPANGPRTDHIVASVNLGPGSIRIRVACQGPPMGRYAADQSCRNKTVTSIFQIVDQAGHFHRSTWPI